ncbi:vesicle transport protein SFT2B [Schistocerca americana]|uniref:vesicle transport protein SFT2B n=1 Tax=Schistocerca americana TaxID=7009 RepID=UPI001F503269|nr:vesicle transport protein SFT2B [Schistocerca americana]XP_047110140.1 vesicle transport protein SFT2B [Schistocerca piceifrons]XP_049776842.1 vesicle transport protein SFT2B [Schistocerca cancellata]XP_049790229.1 vesicle transport protein SFT2B [Schistocerca nitens]XP_049857838.1 vesicle transport protein SFT2B [Schistocerca gregaria]XP_049952727.1 vesicle transport protein SFT2B [Schistocerca serialis cubense]
MDKLRRALSGNDAQPEEESGIMPQLMESTTLSWSTRLKGFIVCFLIGILCSILGSFSLFFSRGLVLFAVFYTLGNIITLASTCFLMGPVNQIKKMFAPTRVIATIMVIVMFGLTLFAAIWWKKAGLALLFVILQSLAMTWYSISYIPYARDAVKKTVSACIA